MNFEPLKIPGFIDALLEERLIRDDALLGTPEDVRGFELRKLTLRDYTVLRIMGNPIVSLKSPNHIQLAQFLWFMSTSYGPKARLRRWLFLRRCRRLFGEPAKPFIETSFAMRAWRLKALRRIRKARAIVNACHDYVRDARQDAPPTKGGGFTPSFYSDALYYCALLGREYGYRMEDVLNMPLKALYGFIAEIRQHYDPKTPLFNPKSEKVLNRHMEKLTNELLNRN